MRTLAETRYEGYFSIAKNENVQKLALLQYIQPLFSTSAEARKVSVIMSEQTTAKTHRNSWLLKFNGAEPCGSTRVLHLTLSHLNTHLQTLD